MLAARDERHVVPPAKEHRSVVAADRSRADDQNLHSSSSSAPRLPTPMFASPD